MAGNALPLVLLAGAAFFLSRKKGGGEAKSDGLPSDQGKNADTDEGTTDEGTTDEGTTDEGETDETPSEEQFRVDWTFDPTANFPWVETLEDYEAWNVKLASDDSRVWTGALEFRDMDERHAEIGLFIEEQMGFYGQTFGRTVDRTELDPEAKQAMADSDLAVIEKGIDKVFVDVPGVDFLLVFLNDAIPFKMSILFVYDSFESQSQAMGKMGSFKQQWTDLGIQVALQAGYMGMEEPSLKSVITAFLNANLPKKTQIGPMPGPIEASINP